mmetsp:Transcript_11217/g.24331  ORF Transcript_11217/g.24331 Transcript_11217/m.24331 type:complete len:162 (+) Transcript_11217:240-725(+)
MKHVHRGKVEELVKQLTRTVHPNNLPLPSREFTTQEVPVETVNRSTNLAIARATVMEEEEKHAHTTEEVMRHIRMIHRSSLLPLQYHEATATRKDPLVSSIVHHVNHIAQAAEAATVVMQMTGEALDTVMIIMIVVAANETMSMIGEMEDGKKIINAAMMM